MTIAKKVEEEINVIADGLYTAEDGIEFSHYKQRIVDLIGQVEEEAKKEMIEKANKIFYLLGEARCQNLHHTKKQKHYGVENCPVVAEIERLFLNLNTK